jgi:hypothetical protein
MSTARAAVLVAACALMSAAPASAATLVHHWKGDDSAVDTIAANDGVWSGTEAYTPGVLSNAFSFDGASYVAAPSAASHYPSGSFTVDLSAKTAVTSALQMFMSIYECAYSCPSGVANSNIDVDLASGGFPHGFVRDSDAGGAEQGGQEITGDKSFADGTFHRYVLIRDVEASKLALYVDGIEVSEEDLDPDAAGPLGDDDGLPDPLTIGAYIIGDSSTPGGLVTGAVDEVKLYTGTVYPDTTPPSIAPVVSGQGQNGWLQANGQVSWNVTDESILRTGEGCDATPVTSDTGAQTLTCTASSAGGLTSQSITVKRDATPPTVTCPSPAPAFDAGAAGKTVTATVADELSGAAAASVSAPGDTATSGSKSVALTGSDLAGNLQTSSCKYTVRPAPTKQEIALSTAPPSKVAGAFGLPATKTCVSRRRFVVHIRRPAGVTIATAKLTLNSKALKVSTKAGRFSATVDLRGLKRGTYTLAIRVTTASGKTLKGKRRYHTCAKKRRGTGFHAPL